MPISGGADTGLYDLEILVGCGRRMRTRLPAKIKRIAFVTGHPEYDAYMLAGEYFRDVGGRVKSEVPYNYFPKKRSRKTYRVQPAQPR